MFALITFLTALLPSQQADLIFHNGKIVTVDSKFTVHQALASKNGVIIKPLKNQMLVGIFQSIIVLLYRLIEKAPREKPIIKSMFKRDLFSKYFLFDLFPPFVFLIIFLNVG